MSIKRSAISRRLALPAFVLAGITAGPRPATATPAGVRGRPEAEPATSPSPSGESRLQGALADLSSLGRGPRDPQSWISDASIFIRNALTTAHGLNAEQTLQVQTPQVLGEQATYLSASTDRAIRDLRALLGIARARKPGAAPAIQTTLQSLESARSSAQAIISHAASGVLAPGNPAIIQATLAKLEQASTNLNAVILAYHLPSFVMRQEETPGGHQQAGSRASNAGETPLPSLTAPRAPAPGAQSQLPHSAAIQGQTAPQPQEAYADIHITLSIGRSEGSVDFTAGELTVKAGQIVALTLINADSRESHDWVLVKPGRAEAVLALGMAAGINPGDDSYEPDVLAKTGVVSPGGQYTVFFVAPRRPGLYPFVSTVGGEPVHASGFLRVEKIT